MPLPYAAPADSEWVRARVDQVPGEEGVNGRPTECYLFELLMEKDDRSGVLYATENNNDTAVKSVIDLGLVKNDKCGILIKKELATKPPGNEQAEKPQDVCSQDRVGDQRLPYSGHVAKAA